MNIVVLGGAGRVGRRIVQMILERDLGSVTVADRVEVDTPGVRSLVIDVADRAQLTTLLAEHDLVVNCVGPYDYWGTHVLEVAISAGTNYVDLCDDPEPTQVLLGLDEKARDAGISAVIGLGSSPGLSNLMAVVADRELDETDLLVNYWGDPNERVTQENLAAETERAIRAFSSGRAAFTHVIQQAASPIPVWIDGAPGHIAPWQPEYRVTYSTGQNAAFRPIGHPEPLTLPQHTQARHCICIGTLGAGNDRAIAQVLPRIAAGEVSVEDAPQAVADLLREQPELLLATTDSEPLPALIGAVAIGRRHGQPRSVIVIPGGPTDGSMSSETARPCVLGIEMFDTVPTGVHSPEGAFDAYAFLDLFSQREWNGAAPFRVDHQVGEMFRLDPDSVVSPADPTGEES